MVLVKTTKAPTARPLTLVRPSEAARAAAPVPPAPAAKADGFDAGQRPSLPSVEDAGFAKILTEMRRDLELGMRRLVTMPAAATVLGSARVKPGDRAYDWSVALGEKLAQLGVPVRTGAGPGVMGAAPLGFLQGRPARDAAKEPQRLVPGTQAPNAAEDDLRTQGFNIILPYEQDVDPAVEHHMAIKHFPFRKLMLFENTRSLITMPGGYGTLDELFEIWAMPHKDPMHLVDTGFWQPILDAVVRGARRGRELISDQQWSRMDLTDDLDAVAKAAAKTRNVSGFEEDPEVLSTRLLKELKLTYDELAKLPPSVTFLGAAELDADDPALQVLSDAAALLAKQGHPARLGGSRPVAEAVERGAAKSGGEVHAFPKVSDGDSLSGTGVDVLLPITDIVTQKQALTRGIEGMVVAPGDLDTLGELFTFLCEVQCGKVPKVPIVLVGTDYWQPLFDAIKASMLEGERATISAEDLDLVTITDDPAVVAGAFAKGTSVPVPGHGKAAKVTSLLGARLQAQLD